MKSVSVTSFFLFASLFLNHSLNADVYVSRNKDGTLRFDNVPTTSGYPSRIIEKNAPPEVSGPQVELRQIPRNEAVAIQNACAYSKYSSGPAAYDQCIADQLTAVKNSPGRPLFSEMTRAELAAIENACAGYNNSLGPAAYYQCLHDQLTALRHDSGQTQTTREPGISISTKDVSNTTWEHPSPTSIARKSTQRAVVVGFLLLTAYYLVLLVRDNLDEKQYATIPFRFASIDASILAPKALSRMQCAH